MSEIDTGIRERSLPKAESLSSQIVSRVAKSTGQGKNVIHADNSIEPQNGTAMSSNVKGEVAHKDNELQTNQQSDFFLQEYMSGKVHASPEQVITAYFKRYENPS